jgi:hypothetical protein
LSAFQAEFQSSGVFSRGGQYGNPTNIVVGHARRAILRPSVNFLNWLLTLGSPRRVALPIARHNIADRQDLIDNFGEIEALDLPPHGRGVFICVR